MLVMEREPTEKSESDPLEPFNFSMPQEIAREFRAIGNVHGERNKMRWAVAAAAVLRLLEMPEGEMEALIQRVYGARHFPRTLEKLVQEAKAKAAKKSDPCDASETQDDPSIKLAPPTSSDARLGSGETRKRRT